MKRLGTMFFCLACVLVLVPMQSGAVCLRGHPTVTAEIATSRSVVIGTVMTARDVTGDPGDPGGITSTVYTLKVTEVLSGRSSSQIRLVSDNTSSRFPMDVGESYIVFVQSNGSELYTDSCGNSGALPNASSVVKKVREANSRPGLTVPSSVSESGNASSGVG
jgi:hypothetical protein